MELHENNAPSHKHMPISSSLRYRGGGMSGISCLCFSENGLSFFNKSVKLILIETKLLKDAYIIEYI